MYAPETVAKMKAANAWVQLVEVDAGHNIAAENPDGFLKALGKFMNETDKAHEHARH